jgi:hypothetical protein
MDQSGEDYEKTRIETSTYTHGQFAALHDAEQKHRLFRVIDWMLDGVDSWLEKDKLERLLVLRGDRTPIPPRSGGVPLASQSRASSAPAPAPDRLLLRGLLGTARTGQIALINDASLGPDQSARVRVGQTNVLIRCLEIRTNSVLIRIEPAGEQQELFLRAR